jgi:hypothetical protein
LAAPGEQVGDLRRVRRINFAQLSRQCIKSIEM